MDRPREVKRRDADASRRRLLAAAAEEFVARGLAGARVDRISARAGANKRLIYDYFGGKDGLFDAVLDNATAVAVGAVPIDADDLPQYCARLFDYHWDHPDLLRLVTWARLEGRRTDAAQRQRQASYRSRVAAIEEAQRDGRVTSSTAAPRLLDMIESLAVGWTAGARNLIADSRQLQRDRRAHRAAIVEAVRRIVSPD